MMGSNKISGWSDVFDIVIGEEGGFTNNPEDPGNWTGGRMNVGELKGTKFGISAAAFPHTDIEGLTIAEAEALAKIHYWDPYMCDRLPPVVAYLVFDTAYNGGQPIRWLQRAARVMEDGVLGPKTMAALTSMSPAVISARFMAYRLDYWRSLDGWKSFSSGWAGRASINLRIIADNL